MKIVRTIDAMKRQSAAWVKSGESVGFVPTMGALHEGHLELVRRARKECRRVVVSIYVNPTQFGPKEDLSRYPRPLERDLALCRKEGADIVFNPPNLYWRDHSTWVEETKMSEGREGALRPGHFRGVATIVLKLFNIVRPTRAYFGQKDAQQVDVIERMVRDLDVPVKIIVVPIVRAADGVALSSRNVYLSPEERKLAAEFARLLQHAAREQLHSQHWLQENLKKLPGVQLDYAEQVSRKERSRLVAAVKIGTTRLLDNERIRTIHQPEGFAIATKSGWRTSHCFIHFTRAKLKDGKHTGWCGINGTPLKPNQDQRALLRRLKKYKGARKECILTVAGNKWHYRIVAEGLPDLTTRLTQRKKGASVGKLYAGKNYIGRAVLEHIPNPHYLPWSKRNAHFAPR
jgi:pantoate--beta-alanine ligase